MSASLSLVRPATSADDRAIQLLIGGIYHLYGFPLKLDTIDAHLMHPSAYFEAKGGRLWVVDDGAVAATVGFLPSSQGIELKCLYVHPVLWRQGWGRALSQMIVDYARDVGAPQVHLWSDTLFEGAHALYTAMAFRRGETRDMGEYQEHSFVLPLGPEGTQPGTTDPT